MEYAKKILSRPFLVEGDKEEKLRKGFYYARICTHYGVEIDTLDKVLEKASEENVIQEENGVIKTNLIKRWEVEKINNMTFEEEKIKKSLQEQPMKNPDNKYEKTVKNLAKQNGLTTKEAVKWLNTKINQEQNKNREQIMKEIMEKNYNIEKL